MFKNILLSVVATLASLAIVAAIATEKRVSILEEREKTTLEYFKSIDTKMSYVLCTMGEKSECK